MTALVLLFIVEATALAIAHGQRRTWLGAFVIQNMVFIPFLGARMIEVGGLVSNVGNVFYAFALAGFALVIGGDDPKRAQDIFRRTFAAFILIGAVLFCIKQLPVVPGNEAIALWQNQLYDFNTRTMVASLAALLVAISLFIYAMRALARLPRPLAYAVLLPAVQLVDSAIFFPIAFGANPAVLKIAVDGLLIKIAVGWLTVPLVWILTTGSFSLPRVRGRL